jgi:hypothetical protein
MKTFGYIVGSLACAALGFVGSGCGGGTECGAGTAEVDGECVPTADPVDCATGTTLVGNECVPDGSVICETGTMFDMDTGTCVPDITGCAEGTVLVNGECVPHDETLTGDVQEPAEPNGLNAGDTPGSFTTPAEGDSVVIEGCITPFEDIDQNGELDADFDAYIFSVTEPTLLDITADGVGGLAGGFQIIPLDQGLSDAGWVRFGVDMTQDMAQRQVFLPTAGDYALVATDSRSIFGLPFGSADTCYFITVANVAVPAATPIADGGEIIEGTFGPDVQFYSYDPAAQDLIFGTVIAPSESVAAGLTVMVNGQFVRTAPFDGLSVDANSFAASLNDSDEVILVVDAVIEYAVGDVDFDFDVYAPGVTPAPMDDTITVTNDGDFFRWLAFDANEGDVVHIDMSATSPIMYTIITPDLTLVSDRCTFAGACTADEAWYQLTEGGTYYIRLFDTTETQPASFDLTLTRTHVQPTPVVIDTPITAADLSALNSDFYVVDTSSSDWLTWAGTPTGFEGDMDVILYPRDEVGALDDDIFDDETFSFDGTVVEGRIHPGGGDVYLVRVMDTGTPTGDETYDLAVSDRGHTDLGTVTEAAPVSMTGLAIAADETLYYLGQAAVGDIVTITATGDTGTNLVLSTLDANEGIIASADDTGDAGTETLTVGSTGWFAFMIEDATGTAGGFDLDVTAEPPPTYTATAGTLAFTTVCPTNGSGVVHDLDDDDAGLSVTPVTMPFGFDLFGEATSELTISSNGWATFTPNYDGTAADIGDPIPDASEPNFFVAPFWADGDLIEVCVLSEATQLTVEWNGEKWFDAASVLQFQLVLHDDGSIDFIYGPNHSASSQAATIGIEASSGLFGTEVSYDTAGNADAGTSWTLTPDP